MEQYVTNVKISCCKRATLAQLRTGSLQLEIETGRARNIPAEERLCKVCLSGQVEDEFHFIMQCPLYDCLRNYLYSNIEKKCPDFTLLDDKSKFFEIMQNHQYQLAKYVFNAWNI